MDRVIGGVLGLAAAAAVLLLGLGKEVPLSQSLWRAAVAAFLGYWIGTWVFGKAGVSMVKEAAGTVPPPPAPPDGKTPEGPSAPPTPKAN